MALIGHPLFEQLGKKIFLTEAGEILYDCSQEVFRVLDETAEVLDQLKGIHRGRLNISVATTASAYPRWPNCLRPSYWNRVHVMQDPKNNYSV